jgi:acetyl-CoA carboxylase carboxyl transferase alpha subunit/acetyl-CoA carboxylase carboxyl transferase beta subunit
LASFPLGGLTKGELGTMQYLVRGRAGSGILGDSLAKTDAKGAEAFIQCSNCKKIIFALDFEQNLRVCSLCDHHQRLPARLRIAWTFDPDSFEEMDTELRAEDPLQFPEYRQKLEMSQERADAADSIVSGLATLDGVRVAVAVSDFSFMGGSMGSVAGEKIARTFERGVELRVPVIVFCASGGARMQEGLLSLMQMAKTTAAAQLAARHGIPYVAVFSDPTMAGVLASYASIADVILAEPKALIGFAGARVSKQAGVGRVPDDFQSAEWVFEHGMIDRIVPRKDMRQVLGSLVNSFGKHLLPVTEDHTAPPVAQSDCNLIRFVPPREEDLPRPTQAAKDLPKTMRDWERPLVELEEGIGKLRELAKREREDDKRLLLEERIESIERRRDDYLVKKFATLDPWEKVLIARAEKRPYTLDYIASVFGNFIELDGDRRGFRDRAIVGGTASLNGRPVIVVGHQKGRNISERQMRNFGMSRPEGYRKAVRLFDIAERFRLPVITFIDTPAADPGVDSEARGISEAIAAGMTKMFELTVPTVSIVIGEGGSGGALGIAASNTVAMMEHSIYSVIPPEGCAAILWRQPERGPEAARALNLTAESALSLGLIDFIIPEPLGGAHRDPSAAAAKIKCALTEALGSLETETPEALRQMRYGKFRAMGIFERLS